MSTITWITPRGNLGTVPEAQYYFYQLVASDSDSQPLFYSLLSGSLPAGLYVTNDGSIRGIPTLLTQLVQVTTFSFTIRATTLNGDLADRSFSISVSNIHGPIITPKPDLIGAWFDGNYLEYQFYSANDNPEAVETWRLINGVLPPGLTLSSSGKLSGYVGLIATNLSSLYYEAAGVDQVLYDVNEKTRDKFFNFTVQVTDGEKYDSYTARMLIVSKGSYTADNAITIINNTFITIDADNKYRPIIINDPESLPTLVAGSVFAYKFLAYDPEDAVINWEIQSTQFSGMDQLDRADTQSWNGVSGVIDVEDFLFTPNGTTGPYLLLEATLATRLVIYLNDILLTPNVDYTVSVNLLTFTNPVQVTDIVEIRYISTTKGFDSLLFDQGEFGLPAGLSIDIDTGWIFGTLPTGQVEDLTTYFFEVQAYRKLTPTIKSNKITFSFNVKRTLNEEIIWNSPADLGYIDNGAISELTIDAEHTYGKELAYSFTYQPYRKVPQGLKLLKSGILTGRVTFRYFSLDGSIGWINVASTANLEIGMLVQGVGVASGCKITAINDDNTIEVQPAIYVTQGSILTFSNDQTTQVLSTTTNAISTAIDGGTTTFDLDHRFTVKAEAVDGSISSEKSFVVHLRPYNLAPYENLYLRALPDESQRQKYRDIINDRTLIPENLVYRFDDPLFGVQKNFKILFLPGLSPSTVTRYVEAIERNHFTKKIDFSELKTARAVDNNGNTIYEVVYVDAIDNQSNGQDGPPLEVQLDITNNFLFGNDEYNVIYPNSFENMNIRIDQYIGYTNKGALPRWMTSKQENGQVLGLVRAIVLVYTTPGASKLIKYRLSNSQKLVNGNFSFTADRYQLENYLSQYYSLEFNKFLPSVDTTFDKYPNLSQGDIIETVIVETVTSSNLITIPDNIRVGEGWIVTSRDKNSVISANTKVSSYSGNLLTLSSTISSSVDAAIRINGTAFADYALRNPFDSINGTLVGYARNNLLIDGVYSFLKNETVIFAQQTYAGVTSDGWVDENGNLIPGYFEKVNNPGTSNRRAGIYKINWTDISTIGFDSDLLGFDGEEPGLQNSYFDQSDDSEILLEFVSEILLSQTVKIRTGKSYPATTLQYRQSPTSSIPQFEVYTEVLERYETTFDGGSCTCREGNNDLSRRGGTAFSNNRDKYELPESKDKYIKFPQNGVFV